MADLLQSIIAGQDPLSAQMLAGYQGAQLSQAALDPNYGRNEGPFGALGKIIAGVRGGNMLSDAVAQMTQARAGNRPELARVMTSADPYGMVGANPQGFSDQTLAAVLNGATPQSVAEARLAAANASLAGLNVAGFKNAATQPADAIGTPANKKLAPAAPLAMSSGPDTSGRYPAAAPQAVSPDAAASDPLGNIPMTTPQQRQAAVLDPVKRALILAKIKADLAARQAATRPGTPNAIRPQP